MVESCFDMNLYSLKLRSALLEDGNEKHSAGAERLVNEEDILPTALALLHRGINRNEEPPDFVNLKIERISRNDVVELDALPVRTIQVSDADAGFLEMRKIMETMQLPNVSAVLELLQSPQNMRGAMLLNVDTLERLEPNSDRGIRVTYMDAATTDSTAHSTLKNHFREALILATKVAHAPHIVGELCISDDPDYVTGYVASRTLGYIRITHLKPFGSPFGKRIFLYRGDPNGIADCVEYLENQKVLIRNVPNNPDGPPESDGSPSFSVKQQRLAKQIAVRKAAGLYRECKPVPSGGVLMMSSNNYLGLASAPEVKAFALKYLEHYGVGTGGSRLTTGTTDLHLLLEQKLAGFKQTEAALVFGSGYAANIGIIPAVCRQGDVIFSDELNHASLIDGCRLSKAETVIYRHNDMDDLETKIQSRLGKNRQSLNGMIVSDAVFSMGGDVLNYPRFIAIAEKYDMFSMVDEAHSTGVLGHTGSGIAEHFGIEQKPDILMGSLSKALGSEGGFVCGSELLIDVLRNHARSFIFSTSLSPIIIASAIKALDILSHDPGRVQQLRNNVQYFCTCLKEQGIDVQTESAIIPLIVGNEEAAVRLARRLLEQGIIVSAIRYPTVKRGQAMLRLTIMATHTQSELARAAGQIAKMCDWSGESL